MGDPRQTARAYLTPEPEAPWRWIEGGRVLMWQDGTTIAFVDEVEQILAQLAPRGLPPFVHLAALLAIWRPSARTGLPRGTSRSFEALFVKLDELAAASKGASLAKMLLAERALETGSNLLSPWLSQAVVEGLRAGLAEKDLAPMAGGARNHPLDPILQGFWERLRQLDAASFALEVRSGLARAPVAAPATPSPPVDVRVLVHALLDDPELGAVARLARDLMALAHLPRRVSEPEDLPLGGYSDIANRGQLDRLLSSELAHDDGTLAVRVALGEALYLRRETPPRSPRGQRAILLDGGIRLWGVPRVFATAAALALCATTERSVKVRVWRPVEGEVEVVDLLSRAGLARHLEALSAARHPGAALEAFFEAVAMDDAPTDVVLVTHEAVLQDKELRQALFATRREPVYVLAVNRDGDCRLWAVSARGQRLVREAHFDLEEVLAPPQRSREPVLRERDPELPALLSVRPFPFLLPHRAQHDRACAHSRHGVVTLTRDGRLLHVMAVRRRLFRQLTDGAPCGSVEWIHIDDDARVQVVVRSGAGITYLLTAGLESSEVELAWLPELNSRIWMGAFGWGSLVFCLAGGTLHAYGRDGIQCGTLPLPPGARWSGGRYLSSADRSVWWAVGYDGVAPKLEPVPLPLVKKASRFVRIFDRQGLDGPWGFTEKGTVVSGSSYEETPSPSSPLTILWESVRISRDGNRLAVPAPSGKDWYSIDPDRGRQRYLSQSQESFLEPAVTTGIGGQRDLMVNFKSVSFSPSGSVVLHFSGQSNRELRLFDQERLCFQQNTGLGGVSPQLFRKASPPEGRGFTWRHAVWPDGTSIWHDSRGLLHLRSSVLALPEVSIVLGDGNTAAWSSDGKLCGPPELLHGTANATAGELQQRIQSIARRLP